MHKQFLLAALDQARLGRGSCAPNPSVGAVAVLNGIIIAQAWHHGAGTLHAEALLLEQLPSDCSNITLYVTLEPCNHWGRTAPCVDAIIQRRVKHVVYGLIDPNPVVCANNTPALLAQHQVIAQHYPLPEIDAFYESYCHWIKTHKPWVTVKIAQSLDGKIAGHFGKRVNLSNEFCSKFTHLNRKNSDIILTTAQTIYQDNPLLTARFTHETIKKPVAIIDAQLTLNPDAAVFTQAKHCHIYHNAYKKVDVSYKNCSFHPISSHAGKLNLQEVIYHLGTLGYHDVWVEAGAGLFNALHQENLVNRTYIYLVPKILGSDTTPLYTNTSLFKKQFKLTWHPMEDNIITQIDW